MRRAVIIILSTLMLLCVVTVVFGVAFGRRWLAETHENVADVMAESLEASCWVSIQGDGAEMDKVRLLERDVAVNNADAEGQADWETGPEGTFVYGMELDFEPGGIALPTVEDDRYSGMPVVTDGRIEMENIQVPEDMLFLVVLPAKGFERVIEEGLNRCLAGHSLVPTSLSVDDNVIIIQVSAAP